MTPIEPAVRFSIRTPCQPGWREPPRLLYDCELVYVADGAFSVRVENQVHSLQTGDLIVIGPMTEHESWTDEGQRVVRDCLHFDWDRSHVGVRAPLFCAYGSRFESHSLHPVPVEFTGCLNEVVGRRDAEPIVPVIVQMFAFLAQDNPIGESLLYAVLRFLLARKTPGHSQAVLHGGNRAVRTLKNFIDEHYAENIDLNDLSRLVGLTPSHVCMAFRRAIGRPPIQYLNDTRLAHANRLLRESELSVAEVGRAIGFDDANYFSRFFRRKTGVSPSEVR